jgi:hypothetical protein
MEAFMGLSLNSYPMNCYQADETVFLKNAMPAVEQLGEVVGTKRAGEPDIFITAKKTANLEIVGEIMEPIASERIQEKIIDKERVQNFMNRLPEMEKLGEVLDNFYYRIHKDKDLPKFSTFFYEIIENNRSTFEGLDANQKAQILFDKYSELSLARLSMTEEYQNTYHSLEDIIKKWVKDAAGPIVAEKVDQTNKKRVNRHSDFIAVAIVRLMDLKPSAIQFSYEYCHRDLDLSKVSISIF